jgi:hypothetical protein
MLIPSTTIFYPSRTIARRVLSEKEGSAQSNSRRRKTAARLVTENRQMLAIDISARVMVGDSA